MGMEKAPGDLEAVFDQAIELLVQKLEKREAEQCFGPWRGRRAVRESPPPYGSQARDPAPARPFRNGWSAGP
jgi:hypothetical protein